jgi:cadherin EGF LAG seven-pass G-type receptor 1
VTYQGCEVVYDGCPKSFSAGVWWPRTPFGQAAIENCPPKSRGKGLRMCDETSGGWGAANLFNCTSDPFWDLRRQLSEMERGDLQLNTFVSVKMAADLQHATNIIGSSKKEKPKSDKYHEFSLESSFMSRNRVRNNEIDLESFIEFEQPLRHDRLYGADLLITEGILHELIGYEVMQSGLNLSHSQDKDYIRNLVESASIILDKKYSFEWSRLKELTTRGPNDLVDAFNKYLVVLARSQHDTYTNPFEITHESMALGLDIVTAESLFGYEPQLLHVHKTKSGKANQFTTESVVIPDTSAFLQHSSKQRIPTISFPKYNNYMQDKSKFDRNSRVLIPLDMLGILPPESGEVSTAIKQYRAIIGYTQYKDIGSLYPTAFDDTVTRRYGVDVEIATSVLSLTILVPTTGNGISDLNKQMDRMKQMPEQHSDNRIDETFPPENIKHPDDIKIIVHDVTDQDQDGNISGGGTEMNIHVHSHDIFDPNFDSTEQVILKQVVDEGRERMSIR